MIEIKEIYHGSTVQGIECLEPRCLSFREQGEGSVIFATPSPAIASCFMFPWDDSHATMNVFDDGVVHFITCDMKRIQDNDKGGSIYRLLPDDFSYDPETGMKELEWTSPVPQLIVQEKKYSSALQAMREHGINFIEMEEKEFSAFMKMTEGQKETAIRQKNFTLQNVGKIKPKSFAF